MTNSLLQSFEGMLWPNFDWFIHQRRFANQSGNLMASFKPIWWLFKKESGKMCGSVISGFIHTLEHLASWVMVLISWLLRKYKIGFISQGNCKLRWLAYFNLLSVIGISFSYFMFCCIPINCLEPCEVDSLHILYKWIY